MNSPEEEEDHDDKVYGPGWNQLQDSINKLRTNFNTVCESLSIIVDLETTKIMQIGRFEMPESTQRLVYKQKQFIEKLKGKFENYKSAELDSGDNKPEYAHLYQVLTKEVNDSVEKLMQGISDQLSNKSQEQKTLLEEHKTLIKSNQDLEVQLRNEKFRYNKLQSECNVSKSRSQAIEGILGEKSKQIETLQRKSTVALWEREKQKVMDGITIRENQLEEEKNQISGELDTTKDRLNMRIEDLKYKNNILKARQLSARSPSTRSATEELKRNLFIKERGLIIAESELKKQQVYYAGLIAGLARDFEVMMSKDNRAKEQYDLHHRDYESKMSRIKEAIENGTVKAIRASLPYQYHGVEVILKGSPVKTGTNENKKTFYVDAKEVDVDLSKIPVNKRLIKWRLGDNIVTPPMRSLLEDIKKHHPSLIMKNGALMANEAKTFFPYFSEAKIRKNFAIFKTLDENGDFNLDTAEILRHIPSLLGRLATTEEVGDVIQEIDIDGSGTIDFFEFLLLIRLLEEGQGEAKLLKQESEKQKQKTENKKETESKVCSIM